PYPERPSGQTTRVADCALWRPLSRCSPFRLADQERRVSARSRPVLLRAAVVDFRDVKVACLVDAHAVHAPHAAVEITPGTPRIQEVAVEVVLEDLVRAAVGSPEKSIAVDDEHVDVRR